MSGERRLREDTVASLLSLYRHCKDQGETVSLGLETSRGDHYLSFSLRTNNNNNKQQQHQHLLQELSYSDTQSTLQSPHSNSASLVSLCCLQYERLQLVV